MEETLLSKDEQIAQLRAENKELRAQLNNILQQLDKLQRMVFGQKSERQPKKDKDSPNTSNPKTNKTAQAKKPKGKKNGRRALPKNLPREEITHDIDAGTCCPHCQGTLKFHGTETSEQLEIVRALLYVLQHHCKQYVCCSCSAMVTAKKPEQPIDKGLAGPALLAETLVAKYEEHLPLYRQAKRYGRLGYEIPRSTLCDWVTACAERLEPIVIAMQKDMLKNSPKIHTDDTTIPVLSKSKTHKGRFWVYCGSSSHGASCIIYRYTKTRKGEEPQNFLKNYKGYLQADAYSGYDQCYASGDIIEVACFAHARRKFVDAIQVVGNDLLLQEAIDLIGKLYAVEKIVKPMTDLQRYYYRRRYAKPKLKELYRWLVGNAPHAPPKSPLGTAINYCLNHWRALNNYLRDGCLSIDNNLAERAIRGVVLGRKNYLFAGSHDGAKHAATIYSLIETCKALGINSSQYLTDVLTRLPTTLNSAVETLFPYNWSPISSTSSE